MFLGFILPWFGGLAALSLVSGVSFSTIAALPVIFMLGMLLVLAPMAWLYHRYAPLTCPCRPTNHCFNTGSAESKRVDMPGTQYPVAVVAADVSPRPKQTVYPEPFASRVSGRAKTPLGDLFGLTNFGVNLTRLAPGAQSALRHAHKKQDEFVYVLQGSPTLITDEGERQLSPGMCAGFKAGAGNAHHLINRTTADVAYLEVGDRTPGDESTYPDDDIQAAFLDGKWLITHKDGRPY
jgi:uncharacterized cupin superfamily protein